MRSLHGAERLAGHARGTGRAGRTAGLVVPAVLGRSACRAGAPAHRALGQVGARREGGPASVAACGQLRSPAGQAGSRFNMRSSVPPSTLMSNSSMSRAMRKRPRPHVLRVIRRLTRIAAVEIEPAAVVDHAHRDALPIDTDDDIDVVRAAAVQDGVGTRLVDADDNVPGGVMVDPLCTKEGPYLLEITREPRRHRRALAD